MYKNIKKYYFFLNQCGCNSPIHRKPAQNINYEKQNKICINDILNFFEINIEVAPDYHIEF